MTKKFTTDHVWLQLQEPADALIAVVGITPHAQETLGDVVFVELPAVGATFARGDVAGVVESVKAAADVFMPLDGVVTEVNEALRAEPSLANAEPLDSGWFFKIRLREQDALAQLMSGSEYEAFCASA
jgi:glycine cleavage system H protein